MNLKLSVKITNVLEQKYNSRDGEKVKHLIVGETQEEYSKMVCFDVFNEERWNKMLPYLQKDRVVEISFDISSREYNGKYFTSATAFSVYGGGGQQQSAVPNAQPAPEKTQENNGNDNLPF